MSKPRFIARLLAALALLSCTALAGASGVDEFEQQARKEFAGPKSAPMSTETGFSRGLHCMDDLLRRYGIENVKVLIEDIPDATKKMNFGARDMFVTATAQMTRTSHAIKLVELPDPLLLQIISSSSRSGLVTGADYIVRGSISQFDDSMLQKQRDGAVCIWYLCLGGANSDSFSALGLDINLVDSGDWSLVPGANVHDAVLIRKRGNGLDGDFTIKQYSIQYDYTLSSTESYGQALRTLIEIGTIQLYGRLLKLPYWSCLGARDDDPAVRSEIDEWWDELAGDEGDRSRLLAYLQMQMRNQGVYDGPVDGKSSPELLRAVRAYKLALGQPDTPIVDVQFLRAYLAADHDRVRRVAERKLAELPRADSQAVPAQAAPAPAERAAPALAAAPVRADRIRVIGSVAADRTAYRAGEPFSVAVALPEDGYLYCFAIDGERRVTQFYPAGDQPVEPLHRNLNVLNPKSPLLAPAAGERKDLACFSSLRNLGRQPFGPGTFDASGQELESRFSTLADGAFEKGGLHVKVQ